MLLSRLLKKIEYSGNFTDCEIDFITNNSYEARQNTIFVCIRGFATDGHIYALSAYEKGCRVFVCEYIPTNLPSDATVIIVSNTRIALAVLSSEIYGHPSKELLVIGITGTKGKTTTSLMIKQMLDRAGIPAGYIGSNGVIFGGKKLETANTTPESYKLQGYMRDMADSGIKAAVLEVSSQALKQSRVLGISFDITLFTNLYCDHIGPGEHDNWDDYFDAKKKLFNDFDTPTVIANADDPYTESMLADCKSRKIYYSVNKKADYSAKDISLCRTCDMLGISFDCHCNDGAFPCSLAIPGEFNIHNALATFATANAIGIDPHFISQNLSSLRIDGRFETVSAPNGACFVIDYAHNGVSLQSALMALREYEPNRLICLFGSVGNRTQVRRAQMGAVASKYADFSILTSDNPNTENPQNIIDDIAEQFNDDSSHISIPDRREAIKYAINIAKAGDIVLLAGKGHEKYQLIGGKKQYFCEREIIEDYINEIKITK